MDDEQPVANEVHEQVEEAEVVDGVLVLATARTLEPVREPATPFRQVAAVAATSFVAGAATAAVLGRRYARREARHGAIGRGSSARSLGEGVEVVASRRFIVDVHSIARR